MQRHVVPFEVAKNLVLLGYHEPVFYIYQDGELTHTGRDGFDEGEFNFLSDNYIDANSEEGKEQLIINKTVINADPSLPDPEFISAPGCLEVETWLGERFGVHMSHFRSLDNKSWTTRIDREIGGKVVSRRFMMDIEDRLESIKEALLSVTEELVEEINL